MAVNYVRYIKNVYFTVPCCFYLRKGQKKPFKYQEIAPHFSPLMIATKDIKMCKIRTENTISTRAANCKATATTTRRKNYRVIRK